MLILMPTRGDAGAAANYAGGSCSGLCVDFNDAPRLRLRERNEAARAAAANTLLLAAISAGRLERRREMADGFPADESNAYSRQIYRRLLR